MAWVASPSCLGEAGLQIQREVGMCAGRGGCWEFLPWNGIPKGAAILYALTPYCHICRQNSAQHSAVL